MNSVYQLIIRLYGLSIRLAALWNRKAALWVKGRKNWQHSLSSAIPAERHVCWFHCASLGEFEQGRPLMEALKAQQPDIFLLLTFFSPSGYEIRKNYALADHIMYLPLDTNRNARKFINLARPQQAFFVKYEFWPNYIRALSVSKTKLYNVSGAFRPGQVFFKKHGQWYRNLLQAFTWFFVQNQQSAELLKSIDIEKVTISGDTRFDRVLKNAAAASQYPVIEAFCLGHTVFIGGSTWPVDEQMIAHYIARHQADTRFILVPHEVGETHIARLQALLGPQTLRYTQAITQTSPEARVLIVDTIGILATAYRHAHVAYVGGAFGKGLHNILEAAVYGLPVIFGPRHSKFPEAEQLIEAGGGFSVSTHDEFTAIADKLLLHTPARSSAGQCAAEFVRINAGATARILARLSDNSNKS